MTRLDDLPLYSLWFVLTLIRWDLEAQFFMGRILAELDTPWPSPDQLRSVPQEELRLLREALWDDEV